MFCSMVALSTPSFSSWSTKRSQEGSTFVETKPFSASYPMCETCLNVSTCGAEIRDLSILPPFFDFLVLDLALDLAGGY